MAFNSSILRNHNGRARMLAVLESALGAVEPARLTAAALERLPIGDQPATVVAIGKAAPAMAGGAADTLGPVRAGLIVTDHPEDAPPGFEQMIGGHPLPDGRSLRAAERALELLAAAPAGSPIGFLVSGGGSALFELPAPGLTLDDLQAANRLLLSASIPISAVNQVRTAMSAVKGGGLGVAASHLRPFTLVLSDVGRAGAATVASGLTVPPVPADLEGTLRRHDVWERLPAPVRARLESERADPAAPPPHPVVIVGDGSVAAAAAATRAGELGWEARIVEEELSGEAAEAARRMLGEAGPGLTISYGETTVALGEAHGSGGRNQEAGLAAALEGDGREGWLMAALATDGIDGNTRAAGAMVDGDTAGRIRRAGLDPQGLLRDHDSHRGLDAAGDLLVTGPTGTNVADLWLVLRAD